MGIKNRYIEQLTAEQESSLEKNYKNGKSPVTRRKCQAILLSASGKSVKEIASFYQVKTRTIYEWFNEWESDGINGIKIKKGRGRKTILNENDPTQSKIIYTLVENNPQSLNRVLQGINDKLGLEISKKALKQYLKKNLNSDGNEAENE